MFFSYKSLLFTYWTEIRVSERFRSSLLLSFSRYEHAPQCPIIFNGCDTTLNFPTDTVPTSQVFLKKKSFECKIRGKKGTLHVLIICIHFESGFLYFFHIVSV
jgi:hypothetical protein